jgi:integrase
VPRDVVRGVLTSPKSHQRRLDMSAQLAAAPLARRRHRRSLPPCKGTPFEKGNVRHVFTRLLERAELRQIRIHELRHT